jgi:hypothetical protein
MQRARLLKTQHEPRTQHSADSENQYNKEKSVPRGIAASLGIRHKTTNCAPRNETQNTPPVAPTAIAAELALVVIYSLENIVRDRERPADQNL